MNILNTRYVFQHINQNNGSLCSGDSRGPVHGRTRDGDLVVIGITSLSSLKCHEVHDEVAAFVDADALKDDIEK